MPPDHVAAASACRLCGGATQQRFHLTLLGRHRVGYFVCMACGSLQTEAPHWLAEAYASGNLSPLDTGAAQRCIDNQATCIALARWLGLRNAVEFGGGDGLLCRLLRDHGLNGFSTDRHARSVYAQGFDTPDFQTPDLVLAFEVIEHFADPGNELKALFAGRPRAVLVSTDVYWDQGADWWYLSPETGQHVFFYSRKALRDFGAGQGYRLVTGGPYSLFVRDGEFSPARVRVARLLLKPRLRTFEKAWLLTRTPSGIWQDHERLASQQRPRAPSTGEDSTSAIDSHRR